MLRRSLIPCVPHRHHHEPDTISQLNCMVVVYSRWVGSRLLRSCLIPCACQNHHRVASKNALKSERFVFNVVARWLLKSSQIPHAPHRHDWVAGRNSQKSALWLSCIGNVVSGWLLRNSTGPWRSRRKSSKNSQMSDCYYIDSIKWI